MLRTLRGRIQGALGKRMLANMVSLALLQGANYLLPLVTLPYLVRTLGLEAYGEMNFGLAFVQYFTLLTSYGFGLSATRAVAGVAGDRQRVSEIFWSVIACKLLLAFGGLALMLGLTEVVPLLHGARPVLLAGYTGVIADIVLASWLFQGLEQMGIITVCFIAAKAISVPATFVFVQGPQDSWLAAFIQGLTGVLAGLFSLVVLYRRRLVCWVRPTLASIWEQLAEGWHIFLSTAAISLYTTTNSVLLGFLSGNVAVGEFVAADKVRLSVQSATYPISAAVYPRICVLIQNDREKGFRFIRALMLVQGLVTFGLSLAILVLAGFIVHIIYGARYENAVACLQWLAFLPFVTGLSGVFGVQTMLPLGMKRPFSRILIFAGLLNIGMLVVLSRFYGAPGAAMALLITEIIITGTMAALLIKKRIPVFRFMPLRPT